MTKKEQEKYLKSFKEYKKNVVSTRETAVKFMEETGIINKSGKLATEYKNVL